MWIAFQDALCAFSYPLAQPPWGCLTPASFFIPQHKEGHILRGPQVKENCCVLEGVQTYLPYSLQEGCYHDLFLGTESASMNFKMSPPRGPSYKFLNVFFQMSLRHHTACTKQHSMLLPAPCLEIISKIYQPGLGNEADNNSVLINSPKTPHRPHQKLTTTTQLITRLRTYAFSRQRPSRYGDKASVSKVRKSEQSHVLARYHSNRKQKTGNQG